MRYATLLLLLSAVTAFASSTEEQPADRKSTRLNSSHSH